MRVLIANTDEPFVEILQSQLWKRGHDAEIAFDGLDCIAMLREFQPDLLVLDLNLLWGGGDGVLAELRTDPRFHGIPVIMLTDGQETFNPLGEPPIVAQLERPLGMQELLICIKTVGDRSLLSESQCHHLVVQDDLTPSEFGA